MSAKGSVAQPKSPTIAVDVAVLSRLLEKTEHARQTFQKAHQLAASASDELKQLLQQAGVATKMPSRMASTRSAHPEWSLPETSHLGWRHMVAKEEQNDDDDDDEQPHEVSEEAEVWHTPLVHAHIACLANE